MSKRQRSLASPEGPIKWYTLFYIDNGTNRHQNSTHVEGWVKNFRWLSFISPTVLLRYKKEFTWVDHVSLSLLIFSSIGSGSEILHFWFLLFPLPTNCRPNIVCKSLVVRVDIDIRRNPLISGRLFEPISMVLPDNETFVVLSVERIRDTSVPVEV